MGRHSTCEQRDNCPTLTYEKWCPPVAWDKQCRQSIPKDPNWCVRLRSPCPPLKSPPCSTRWPPMGGGGRQMTVSRRGGGGARVSQGKLQYPRVMQANKTQVKQLLHCCGANVIHAKPMLLRIHRNGKEILGTRIAHFELLQMFSLHDGHWVIARGWKGTNRRHLLSLWQISLPTDTLE